jgi:uncharacterized membrane protein YedE/YeeE
MDLKNIKLYNKWFKNSWPYATGAVILSILQIVTLTVTGNPWGITSSFVNLSAWIYSALGGDVSNWQYYLGKRGLGYFNSGFMDPVLFRNIGIILGALLAGLLASQFRIKKIKSIKQVTSASIGGLLMGYGASIASGCNIGALFSGISSFSLSGWVFAIFLFIGAVIGSKILVKYLM